MFWFILFLLAIGTGFYLHSSSGEIEDETTASPLEPYVQDKIEPSIAAVVVPVEAPGADEVEIDSLSGRIIELVTLSPGMKQTELYSQMGDISKKSLQQLLKELADSGRIIRDKSGTSYLLYPKV